MANNHMIVKDVLIQDYLPLIGSTATVLYQYHQLNSLKGKINPSLRTIARDTKISINTIRKDHKILERFQLITIIKGDNTAPNGYVAHQPSKTKLRKIIKTFS